MKTGDGMNMKGRVCVCAVLGLLVALGSQVAAQVTTGMVSGTVKEASGAVVPGATVAVTNIDTGVTRTTVTDDVGRYRISNLAVGVYQIAAEIEGFKKEVRSGVTLTVGREAIIDITLEIGQITQEIVITADAPLVNVTSGEVAGLVDQKTINDLPLNGRDLLQLMTLEPGVTFVRNRNTGLASGGSGQRVTIQGTRETQNLFLLDGTTLNDTLGRSPGGEAGVFMGAEAVKEFKVILHNFSAEYGRAAGGVFNAVTKSGSNQVRGSVFEFHRNSRFDASNFFDTAKPPFTRHQFGASTGGPIRRNKTFFFANYEGLRDRLTTSQLLVVPSEAGRQGVLGATRVTVVPAVAPYLALFPLPNGRDFGDGTGEFSTRATANTDEDYLVGRVDHRLGDSSLFVRYTYDNSTRHAAATGTLPDFPDLQRSLRHYVTAEHTTVLSRNLINVARLGYTRSATSTEPVPANAHEELAFVPGRKMGALAITGLPVAGSIDTDIQKFTLSTWQLSDSFQWSRGSNQLKVGMDLNHYSFDQIDTGGVNGRFQFASLADFLQGRTQQFGVAGTTGQEVAERTFTQWMVGGYVQDDQKIGSRFTLNLGLRYETATVPEEVDGRWATLLNLTDPTTTVGLPIFNNPTRKNFAPRLGFAWDPQGNGRTAIRGGFGLFYDPPLSSQWRNRFNNPPFRAEATIRTTPVFPSTLTVQPELYRTATTPSTMFLVERDPKAAYVRQFNLTLQREVFSGTVVSVGYSGHRGRHLLVENDLNIGIPTILANGQKFFPAGTRPLNPNFARMRTYTYNGDSQYDAATVQVQRRLSQGLQFQLSYAFSKTMDHSSLTNRGDGFSASKQQTWQDPYNKDAEWSLSDFHFPHNLVMHSTYLLPFGQQSRLGGWQLSAIFTAVSGPTFNPKVGFDVDRDTSTDNQTRPNLVPGVPLILGGVDQYFNPLAFSLPEPGFYGDSQRNMLTGPPLRTLDLSLTKITRLRGNSELQLRLEAFNALNRANFGLPLSTVFDSRGRVGSAGRITSTVTPARQMQFGAKLVF